MEGTQAVLLSVLLCGLQAELAHFNFEGRCIKFCSQAHVQATLLQEAPPFVCQLEMALQYVGYLLLLSSIHILIVCQWKGLWQNPLIGYFIQHIPAYTYLLPAHTYLP